jgi:hypothetical protein
VPKVARILGNRGDREQIGHRTSMPLMREAVCLLSLGGRAKWPEDCH